MGLSYFGSLAASRRFGKATRLQARGALDQALALLTVNRTKLASANASSVPSLSLRLMNLVRLAEVAKALGRTDLAKSALEEWLTTWEAARRDAPTLATVESLTRWENWVRAALAST